MYGLLHITFFVRQAFTTTDQMSVFLTLSKVRQYLAMILPNSSTYSSQPARHK